METTVVKDSLGIKLCKAMGIDTAGIHSITLKCIAGKADEITITRFVKDSNEVRDIIEAFKGYEWEKE